MSTTTAEPLRVALLVPERLPRWLENSDLHQNRALLELTRWTDGRIVCVPMAPLPRETALAAIAPLAAMRALERLPGRGVRPLATVHRLLQGVALVTRPLAADVVLGHGLFPLHAPWVKHRAPLVWGPGYAADDPGFRARQRRDPVTHARLASAAVVFLSNAASAEALRADFALPEERVRVIPLLQGHLPESGRLSLANPGALAPADPLRVLFVGRQARRKNLPRVLAARRMLAARGLRTSLTVVSDLRDGPVGLDGDVTLIEALAPSEVFALMQRHDVLCMPSLAESYGLVFIEALAAGLAVIAPDAVTQRSMLGLAATYADPQDVESIAEALRTLAHPGARAAQIAAGFALFATRYAPDVVAAAFEGALRAAMKSTSPAVIDAMAPGSSGRRSRSNIR